MIFLLPILIFAFFQFTIGRSDSWLSIFLAAVAVAFTCLPLIIVFILSLRRAKRDYEDAIAVNPLYTRARWYGSVGMIYRQYRQKYHFWWFAPMAIATFAQAAFVGFGRNNRWAQVIGLMVVEFIDWIPPTQRSQRGLAGTDT
jgi:MFS family permease